MNIEEVKDTYSFSNGQARDKKTHKIFHCPKSIGFKVTLVQCLNQSCKQCWEEVKECIEYMEKANRG